MLTLDDLRRYAVARSLLRSNSVIDAVGALGFVQADPIRRPARAQDLILRHRVAGYRAGELEALYPTLPIEEDFFINYGFLRREVANLMHPRTPRRTLSQVDLQRANEVLAFVRERGVVHPSHVDAHFKHGRQPNWFGGSSRASTQLLDAMHYRGMLRTAKRQAGIRCYELRQHQPNALSSQVVLDQLLDVAVNLYAPLPAKSLSALCSLLFNGVPQWRSDRAQTLARAQQRLASAEVARVRWFWPAHEQPQSSQYQLTEDARLLAPFDPMVWDRTRFELLWGWAYRFEAYTPAAKRQLGYYAMPLLVEDQIIGWGNIDGTGPALRVELGLKQRFGKTRLKSAIAPDMQALSEFLSMPIGELQLR